MRGVRERNEGVAGASHWTERHKSLGEREEFIQHGLWIKIKRFSDALLVPRGKERKERERKEDKRRMRSSTRRRKIIIAVKMKKINVNINERQIRRHTPMI